MVSRCADTLEDSGCTQCVQRGHSVCAAGALAVCVADALGVCSGCTRCVQQVHSVCAAGVISGCSIRPSEKCQIYMLYMQALASEGMQLSEAQERVREVSRSVHHVIGECMEAVSHELTFFPLADCFALFGFDLMVSRDWRVWLLEANADPDFSQACNPLMSIPRMTRSFQ